MAKHVLKKEEKQPKLASIEILKFHDKEIIDNLENMSEENFEIIYNANLITRYFPVTDLKDKYVIRVAMLKENSPYEVIDPNEVNPLDQFELTESITQMLQKLGLKAVPLKSEEELQKEAFEAGKEKLKEIQKKLKEKIDKKLKGVSDETNENSDKE
jgi:hypothetical protein